jgi:Mrp family chromosome partitioning ATPase
MQLAAERQRAASFGERRLGIVFGITSAASGEGKSTHALALARTAALAGESVVLIDADLRRSGVSRLLDQEFCFTLRDFLQDRCTADDVISIEERSGVHFVPSIPNDFSWTSHDLQRFLHFIDYLKNRFAIVIIDLPPVLGLAETIRLAMAADRIALVIRWGRTERQFVQLALGALRTASVSTTAVILNDVDLKAQRRRGYRDSSVVYTDKGLYRAASGYREPAKPASLPMAAAKPAVHSETSVSEPRRRETHRDRPRPAGSDIERLYDRYHG